MGDLGDGGDVEGVVDLAVAAGVEAVPFERSAGGVDGGGPVEAVEAPGVYRRWGGAGSGFAEELAVRV